MDLTNMFEMSNNRESDNDESDNESDNNDEQRQKQLDELIEKAKSNIIPKNSKKSYEIEYTKFKDWRTGMLKSKKEKNIDEDFILAYFQKLSETYAATTLWTTYSKLKAMLLWKEKIDISKNAELFCFLKKKSKCHVPKKAKVFTTEQVSKFLNDAPEDQYLLHKVG